MGKMERPMMKVVKFGAEDVIATSSAARGGFYVAKGSEIGQFSSIGSVSGDYDNTSDLYNITVSNDGDSVSVSGAGDNGNLYAWYSTTSGWGWTTQNRSADSYGSLPEE